MHIKVNAAYHMLVYQTRFTIKDWRKKKKGRYEMQKRCGNHKEQSLTKYTI